MTSRQRIDHAARIIVAGGIVAYPTEAVYGLGCLPDDDDALARIVLLKRREARKGLIVVAASTEQLTQYAELPGGRLGDEMRASWPGPVTWIVPVSRPLSPLLTGGRDTIAVRVSDHPIVRCLCHRVGGPIVSTSANPAGKRPARSALGVRRAFGTRIDFVLAGPLGNRDRPSEIRDAVSGETIRQG